MSFSSTSTSISSRTAQRVSDALVDLEEGLYGLPIVLVREGSEMPEFTIINEVMLEAREMPKDHKAENSTLSVLPTLLKRI